LKTTFINFLFLTEQILESVLFRLCVICLLIRLIIILIKNTLWIKKKKIRFNLKNNNNNLIFKRVDKRNIMVRETLNRDIYLRKINDMFLDTNTCIIIKKDSTRIMKSITWQSCLQGERIIIYDYIWLYISDYISDSRYRSLIHSNELLPEAYRLPKIHKSNYYVIDRWSFICTCCIFTKNNI